MKKTLLATAKYENLVSNTFTKNFDDWEAQNYSFWKLWIRKKHIAAKHLDPCFLTTLVKSKYLEELLGKSGVTNPNIPSNLYWAKIWCILLDKRSQWTWIRVTCSTELKSSSPLPKWNKILPLTSFAINLLPQTVTNLFYHLKKCCKNRILADNEMFYYFASWQRVAGVDVL